VESSLASLFYLAEIAPGNFSGQRQSAAGKKRGFCRLR